MAWKEHTDNMIRALVRTTTEAARVDPGLVSDALRVLFRLFRQVPPRHGLADWARRLCPMLRS